MKIPKPIYILLIIEAFECDVKIMKLLVKISEMNVINMTDIKRSTLGLMMKSPAFELLIVVVVCSPIKSTLQNSLSPVFDLFTLLLKTWARAPFLLLDLGILRVFYCEGTVDTDLTPSLSMNLGDYYSPARFPYLGLFIYMF